jgi:cysteine desulfurase / selenocysteine lyase
MMDEFKALKEGMIYFDSAATTLKPNSVIDAVQSYYRDLSATVHRSVYESGATASTYYEATRQEVKEFLCSDQSGEVVFTKSATEALNLLSYSLCSICLKRGDEIIVSVAEHHSNFVPWQEACRRTGAKLVVVGLNEAMQVDLEELESKISARTKIVAINHISNVLGTKNPVKKIASICKQNGVYLVVDGAQSVAHEKIDVIDLECDFFVFSGHKMYGPTGVGVLWGKKELLNVMPPFMFGGSMVEEVGLETSSFQESPQKFEAGTPAIASVLGLGQAMSFLVKNRVRLTLVKELTIYAKQRLIEVFGQECKIYGGDNTIVSFVIQGAHALDLATLLALDGVCVRVGNHCAAPLLDYLGQESLLRLSFGIYNTKQEVDRVIELIKRACLEINSDVSYNGR